MTSGTTQFALVLGDCHIPQRKTMLPKQFKDLLKPGKIQHVLCTGNLGSRQLLDYLKTIAPEIHMVRGDCDTDQKLPEKKIVQIGNFKLGIIHGHQVIPWGDKEALAALRRQMDVDVLISGHTHKFSLQNFDGGSILNPGSTTGAYSALRSEVTPSFILLCIDGNTLHIYVYKTKPTGELDVQKSTFKK